LIKFYSGFQIRDSNTFKTNLKTYMHTNKPIPIKSARLCERRQRLV